MANTYTQIYIHISFHVIGPHIDKSFQSQLYSFIGGLFKRRGHKPLCIGGTHDHVHILFGLNPDQSISDLIKEIKTASTNWINKNKFLINRFKWQEGFGGFSYSRSHLTRIIKYIENQEEHHKHKTFKEEYIEMLEKYGVSYNEKYL